MKNKQTNNKKHRVKSQIISTTKTNNKHTVHKFTKPYWQVTEIGSPQLLLA
jgi:hypothetical protein